MILKVKDFTIQITIQHMRVLIQPIRIIVVIRPEVGGKPLAVLIRVMKQQFYNDVFSISELTRYTNQKS